MSLELANVPIREMQPITAHLDDTDRDTLLVLLRSALGMLQSSARENPSVYLSLEQVMVSVMYAPEQGEHE